MNPEEAFKQLLEGNKRFVQEKLLHPRRDQELREKLKEEQNPMAVVLSCADSRVSPELFFDQGIGDLFIVRIAGNVLSPIALESIKFAILVLKTPLIVVLGHENCGAVKAVVEKQADLIPTIANEIKKHISAGDLTSCIKQNVQGTIKDLTNDIHIQALLEKKELAIEGGLYELSSGRVSFFSRS